MSNEEYSMMYKIKLLLKERYLFIKNYAAIKQITHF